MADRSVRVRLEANVAGFVAQVGVQAVAAVEKLEGAAAKANATLRKTAGEAGGLGQKVGTGATAAVGHLDRLGASAKKNEQSFNTIASGATKVGLTAAVGLGAAAKAAIDWESAWTGVTKTVNGSTTQMAQLEGELRNMAKTLPESHAQIAAVAEAAGQLGVRREDISAFTKVMVNLGETTNLTSDAAATSIAQLMNVMQTAPQDVGRLGAALVALGNNGASTEKDILSMAERISGSGKIVGLSEIQVLGYASALANVGIEAEAGGTAISQIFTKIDKAVSSGGQGLSDFAKVSGLTADQFKQKFATDASGATQLFIQGLGLINQAGGDVNGTLAELGITEIRQRDAVLRLAASGTNLSDSLKTSASGWRENTALVNEAAKRYGTSESQIKVAWNNIKDSAITAGAAMLPVIAQVAGGVSSLAQVFGDLPAPVRNTASALAAVVAVGGLSAAGMLKAAVAAGNLKDAWTNLGRAGRGLTLAAGGIGVALVIATAIYSAFAKTNADAKQRVEDLRQTLDASTGAITGNTRAYAANQLAQSGLAQKAKDLGLNLSTVTDAALGNQTALQGLVTQLDAVIAAGTQQSFQGRAGVTTFNQQALAAQALKDELIKQSGALTDAQKQQLLAAEGAKTNAGATQDAGKKADGAAAATDALGRALDGTGNSAQTAADKLKAYIDALFQVPNLVLGVRAAQRGVQAAIDDATTSLKENGRTLDIHTAKGRANQAALDAIATSANTVSESYLNSNASQKTMTADAVAARTELSKLAHQMGMSKPAADAYAASVIKIPDKKATEVTNNAAGKPKADVVDYTKMLGLVPRAKTTGVTAPGAVSATGQVDALGRSINNLPTGKTVNVTLNTYKNLVETHTVKPVGVLAPPVKADGGFHPLGYPSYADGKLPSQATVAPGRGSGLVQWAEGSTGGEAFIPLAPSKRDRSEMILGQVANTFGMQLVRSFADGGFLPGGHLVDIGYILKQLGIGFNPSAGVNYGNTLKAQNAANSQVGGARTVSNVAAAAEAAAKADVARLQRSITLQQRYVTHLRQTHASHALINAEQKKTIGLQDQLYNARGKLTAATNASNKADATLKLRIDAATKATDAHKVAVQRLVDQQKAAVDMAAQIASGLTSSANIGDLFQQSLTGKGLLADLQGQGAQLGTFKVQIDKLRKRGLSEDLIQQLVGKGADLGGQAAQAILDGGLGLIAALNKAQKALENQANLIGAGSATKKYGQAISGARAGGGPVAPNKAYLVGENGPEVLRMGSQQGWVDPNRYIAGGAGGVATVIHEHHYHQTNQFNGVDLNSADVIVQRAEAKQKLMGRF